MAPPPDQGPAPDQGQDQPPGIILFLQEVGRLVDAGQEDEAKSLIASLPDEALDLLREAMSGIPELDTLLSPLMPKEETPKPQYPEWYKPEFYPRPTSSAVLDTAQEDQMLWQQARDEDADTLQYYLMKSGAGFNNIDPAKDVPFVSTSLRDEADAMISKAATADYAYEIPYSSQSLIDLTQHAENFVATCEEDAAQFYYDRTGQELNYGEAFSEVIFGRILSLIVLNLRSKDEPFVERLMDPATTFPIWAGDRGLERVTCIYEDTVLHVLGDFGDAAKTVETKLRKATNTKTNKPYLSTDKGTVTQYWDRRWYAVYFNGLELFTTEHQYGYPPFVVSRANESLPVWVSDPSGVNTTAVTGSSDTLARYKGSSHMQAQKRAHDQREMVGSKLFTIFSKSDRPAWMVYQDDFARASGAPNIRTDEGDKTLLMKDREEATPMFIAAPQSVFAPLMTMMGSDRQSNLSPPETLGISAGANQSGNAMQQASELGMSKLAPHLKAMERHKAAKASMRLMMWRDWGHLWENQAGDFGTYAVPYKARQRRMNPALPPASDIEPKDVKKIGCRVRCHSSSVPLQALGPLGNAASLWMNNQTMSKRTAMELRGESDPDAEFDEILYETILMDPDLQKAKALKLLKQRDPEAYDEYTTILKQQGGGPPTPPGAGVPNTSGMNLAALGMGPTDPTGRPPGSGPPPPPPGSVTIPPPPPPTGLVGPNGNPIGGPTY